MAHEKRHFVVSCPSEDQVRALLALDGSKIDGQIVPISRAQYSMTGDDLIAFVRQLLEQEEEMNLLRRSYGCGESTPRTIKVVQGETPSSPVAKKKENNGKARTDKKPRGDQKNSDKNKQSPSRESQKNKDKNPEKKAGSPATSDKSEKGRRGDRNSSREKGKCWMCQDLGINTDHDYKGCPKYQDVKKKRDEKRNKRSENSPSGGERSE